MSAPKLKRFYKEVTIVPIEGGFEIQLDGRPLRSPEQNALNLPNAALSEAMTQEWRDQGEKISPPTMPLTKLAFTATDRVTPNRDAVIEQISAFANSDVICYRATEPGELVKRQKECWDPILQWADAELGAEMRTGEGIGYIAQNFDALDALTAVYSDKSDFHLAALYSLAVIGNSLVIALAVAEGEMSAEDAFQCANCDELYQSEKWGDDEEAQARLKERAEEFRAAAEFLKLLNISSPVN